MLSANRLNACKHLSNFIKIVPMMIHNPPTMSILSISNLIIPIIANALPVRSKGMLLPVSRSSKTSNTSIIKTVPLKAYSTSITDNFRSIRGVAFHSSKAPFSHIYGSYKTCMANPL